MFNLAFLVGRLGRNPEIRHTQGGAKVASLRIATSEYYKGQEKTEWHSVTCWDEVLCDVIANRCQKGTLVALMGTIRTRSYEKDGDTKYSTEVVMDKFGSRLQVISGGIAKDDPNAPANHAQSKGGPPLDDEIPW